MATEAHDIELPDDLSNFTAYRDTVVVTDPTGSVQTLHQIILQERVGSSPATLDVGGCKKTEAAALKDAITNAREALAARDIPPI